jgi:glucose-1-phosphatase
MSARVVVFDLGGVVVRVCRTWEEACARAGVDVREPEWFAAFELRERRSGLSDAYQSGKIACADYFAGIARATDGLYSAEEVERVHRAWIAEDYPGIEGVIDELNERGVVTACLSNTNRAHWDDLRRGSRACAAIARPLVSHELGAVKPDDAIYRLAERELGVSPSELLFFDDLEPNVDAARRLGWSSERIDHEGDTASQVRAHLARVLA